MSGTWPKEPPRELWWPPQGGTSGYHRMAGRLTPPPKPTIPESPLEARPSKRAAVWKMLKKVKAPIKKVKARLFQPKEWPARGGSTGYHRMAGRVGKPAAAAPAPAPAPAAAPAATSAPQVTVTSWYDSGQRLS